MLDIIFIDNLFSHIDSKCEKDIFLTNLEMTISYELKLYYYLHMYKWFIQLSYQVIEPKIDDHSFLKICNKQLNITEYLINVILLFTYFHANFGKHFI